MALRAHAIIGGGIGAVPQGLLDALVRVLEDQTTNLATDPMRQACLVQGDFECAFEGADVDIGSAIRLSRERYGGGGSLNFAQALGRYVGGQLMFGVDGISQTTSAPLVGDIKAGTVQVHLGVSPELNFYPKVPIGLLLEYRLTHETGSFDANAQAGIAADTEISATSHRMGGGLYYTGRRDLLLGWIAGASFVQDVERSLEKVGEHPDAFIYAAQIDMRYYF